MNSEKQGVLRENPPEAEEKARRTSCFVQFRAKNAAGI